MRIAVVAAMLMSAMRPASADAPRERAAILAVDLAGGAPEFMRAKAVPRVQEGLAAAGYEVISLADVQAKLPANLATCRDLGCFNKIGQLVNARSLVIVTITRKDESTVIVIKLFDAATGQAFGDVHEVCDLCGQEELEERLGVASSALREAADKERQKRAMRQQTDMSMPVAAGKIRIGVVNGIAVNIDSSKADALASDLADALATELDIEAVGGLTVRRRLPTEGLPADCVTTPKCISDVGTRLNANQLLFVVIVDSGGTIQVDSTWVDVATGRSVSRAAIDVATGVDPKAKFASSAHMLLPDAPLRTKSTTIIKDGTRGTMTKEIPRHFTPGTWTAAAVAAVGLGVGIGFGLSARTKYTDCEKSLACVTSDKDSIRKVALTADIGYIAAIAGTIAAGILFATSGSEPHFVVAPTEGGGTVSAIGRF